MYEENILFIYLTAYSPRMNIIASSRAEKISKYLSHKMQTYIVAGLPKEFLHNEENLKKNVDIGNANLIEIPSIFDRANSKNGKSEAKNMEIIKKIKIELLPVVEYFLPVSPGGMIYHNQRLYLEKIQDIINSNKTKKVVLFASFGPSFILRIAYKIKKNNKNVILINDFRDWAYKYYEGRFYNGYLFKKFTKKMIENSDVSTFVSNKLLIYYNEKLKLKNKKLYFLPNGFDHEFNNKKNKYDNNKKDIFNIVYTGSFHHKCRNPYNFLRALKILIEEHPELENKINFIYLGKDGDYLYKYINELELNDIFVNKGLVDKEESIKMQNEADLLLLITYTGKDKIVGESIITGKFYEYINSNSKILTLGAEGWEMKDVLEADNVSKIISNDDIQGIKNYLYEIITNPDITMNLNKREKMIADFSYKNISEKLYTIIKEVVKEE